MHLLVTGTQLGLYLKSDAYRIAKLPRACPVQTRLGVWEMEHAIIPVLLTRITPDSTMLFESWIDTQTQSGIAAIKALAANKYLNIYLVDAKLERTLRTENEHRAKADAIVRKLERWHRWSTEQVEAAMADIRRMFPTPRAIWLAAASH